MKEIVAQVCQWHFFSFVLSFLFLFFQVLSFHFLIFSCFSFLQNGSYLPGHNTARAATTITHNGRCKTSAERRCLRRPDPGTRTHHGFRAQCHRVGLQPAPRYETPYCIKSRKRRTNNHYKKLLGLFESDKRNLKILLCLAVLTFLPCSGVGAGQDFPAAPADHFWR